MVILIPSLGPPLEPSWRRTKEQDFLLIAAHGIWDTGNSARNSTRKVLGLSVGTKLLPPFSASLSSPDLRSTHFPGQSLMLTGNAGRPHLLWLPCEPPPFQCLHCVSS